MNFGNNSHNSNSNSNSNNNSSSSSSSSSNSKFSKPCHITAMRLCPYTIQPYVLKEVVWVTYINSLYTYHLINLKEVEEEEEDMPLPLLASCPPSPLTLSPFLSNKCNNKCNNKCSSNNNNNSNNNTLNLQVHSKCRISSTRRTNTHKRKHKHTLSRSQ